MSENDNQPPIANVFCKNGCGFYGSSQSDGLCSVCFKKELKQKQQITVEQLSAGVIGGTASGSSSNSGGGGAMGDKAAAMRSSASSSSLPSAASLDASDGVSFMASSLRPPLPAAEDSSSMCSSDASATESQSGDGQQRRARNRCETCRKKVGLTGFECRCGGVYCPSHRYSDKHDCQFDYQGHGQAEIRKANPQVVKSKLDKL